MRKKFIQYYDNVIPPDLASGIEQVIFGDKIDWRYQDNLVGEKVNEDDPIIGNQKVSGFSCKFFDWELKRNAILHYLDSDMYGSDGINLDVNTLFSNVLYKFCHSQNIFVTSYYQGRAFMQLPTKKPLISNAHNDYDQSHLVCLYYVNDSDGDTVFYDDNMNIIKQVTPKKGRVVFFNGDILHSSTSSINNTRAVLNFNFLGKKVG